MSQFSLPGEDWISVTTAQASSPVEAALPDGWFTEAEAAPSTITGAVVTADVAAPESAMTATATQVAGAGSIPFVAALPEDWISETRDREAGMPGEGWIAESPSTVGADADILAIPSPSAAVTARLWARVTIDTGPEPWAGIAAEVMVWEIGQIFDDVPAPIGLVNAQTQATVGALLAAAVPAPASALAGFATQYPVLGVIAADAAPSASVTALVLQSWPFADLRVDLDAPVVAMTATAQAGAAITAELPAPSGAMFADASYPTVAAISSEVPAPTAFLRASVWGKDIYPVAPAEFVLTVTKPTAGVLKPRRPPLGS